MTIQKELTAMKKDITAIGKKLEKLITAVEKSEKAKAPKATQLRCEAWCEISFIKSPQIPKMTLKPRNGKGVYTSKVMYAP